ncbi:MAG: ATP-binding protein [Nitratireductor sp.]|nr:ATP-binding protein [Nitratireductor sp.]
MLIEFRVKNFRSFKEEAVLNLAASSDKTNEDKSIIATGNRSVPRVLKSAGVYGANASGKSNLIRAMQLLKGIVRDSAGLQAEQEINVQPFLLDPVTSESPVEYEVTFIFKGVRYQYGFNLHPTKILNEWLIVYKTNQPAVWFERKYNKKESKYEYKFSSQLLGAKSVWKESTRDNALFLSTAVQLNSEQLRPVFIFLTQNLVVFENGVAPPPDFTVAHMRENQADLVRQFLSAADISIDNIMLRKQDGFMNAIKMNLATGQVEAQTREARELYLPRFLHRSPSGSAEFDLKDESEGTQKLFALAGPIFEILENGKVLIVDELDRSLHTLLCRQLIWMFQDPEVNASNAQLVFTTHDTSLLDGELLRRDQVWFTEKDEHQASHLFPLSDFHPRKGEALERGYLSGRYGGVPILRPLWTSNG